MALVIADRVKESSTTSGTGTITLGGAVSGYQAFTAIGNGNQCYYTIVNIAVATEWEVGVGTYSSSTLTRDTVLSSSNAGAKVSFSAGNKEVFVTYPADRSVSQADIGTAPNEIPFNQYLGSLAYQDLESVTIDGGVATLDTATITSIQNDTAISNVEPSLMLNFAAVKKLDPRITYARASTGVYYDGVTNSKAEENLFLYSQEFDNAYWAKNNGVITANTTTAPDGTTTADTLVCSSGSDWIRQNVTILAALRYTYSISVKENASTTFILTEAGATASSATFTLSGAGSVSVSDNGGSPTATITDVGSGWYRCTFSWTNNAGLSTLFIHNYSPSAFIWGAQVEQRSAVSSYQPTTTQPITKYQPTLLTASANVARFDHDPITNESLGLLIEEQRTNLVTYSEDFSNASWPKINATVTPNQWVAPDGTLTMDKLVENTATGQHLLRRTNNPVLTAGTTYSYSIYAQSSNRNLQLQLFRDSTVAASIFDLSSGTIASTTTGSATIQNVGNNVFRCTVTGVVSGGAVTGSIVDVSIIDETLNGTYTGDGYSGIYIWGAQLEAGAFPTSYIPTVASQVTRSADSASMTGANFSSWYRADASTMYAEFISNASTSTVASAFAISDGSISQMINTYVQSGIVQQIRNVSTQATLTPSGALSVGSLIKTVVSAYANDFAGSVNGLDAVVDTVGSMPIGVDRLQIGSNASLTVVNMLNGTIKKLSYFPARLSNEELQEMTS